MPIIDRIELGEDFKRRMLLKEHKYDYPMGMSLRPGTPSHDTLVEKLIDIAHRSRRAVEPRFDMWRNVDKTLIAYIEQDSYERALKGKDKRKPVSIVVPHSFAILETLLTYLTKAFFQEPIWRYQGVGPEDTLGAMLLEQVVNLMVQRDSRIALGLHTLFRDSLAYGLGYAVSGWGRKEGRRRVQPQGPLFDPRLASDPLQAAAAAVGVRESMNGSKSWGVVSEGVTLTNVDPYRALPDPNASAHDIQSGRFFGWVETSNRLDLLTLERMSSGTRFNAKYLDRIAPGVSAIGGADESARQSHQASVRHTVRRGSDIRDNDLSERVDVVTLFVKIIPSEWGLPSDRDPDYPEKWLFAVGGDQVLLEARPLGLDDDEFPAVSAAPDFDGYSASPVSRMELVHGFQTALNFYYNSRIANQRTGIHGMWLVNPYLVRMDDMTAPFAGKYIRLRRPAWTGSLDQTVKQFPVADITAGNIADAAATMDMMQRVTAATDSTMGLMRAGGERRSAAEFSGTAGAALSRIERIAQVIGLQAMRDLGYRFGSATQQFMEQDVFIKAVGRNAEDLSQMLGIRPGDAVSIRPSDLDIAFDVLVRDGSVPGSNSADSDIQLFSVVASRPELYQAFDLQRWFLWIMSQRGAKNAKDFIRRPDAPTAGIASTAPDESVLNRVSAGDLVPLDLDALTQGAA